MARITAIGTKVVLLGAVGLAALLFLFGQVRFGALALALAFAAIAVGRAEGILPGVLRIRRARTDVIMAFLIAVALATLALALPLGR